jgi:cation transport ATPase
LTLPAPPIITLRPGAIEVVDERVFGPSASAFARRFAGRVLALDEVRALTIEPAGATATIRLRAIAGAAAPLLTRLADAVAAANTAAPAIDLPAWRDGDRVTLYRHRNFVSRFGKLDLGCGTLMIRHPAIARDCAVAAGAAAALRSIAGVIETVATTRLSVRFEPDAVSAEQLVRIIEASVFGTSAKGEPGSDQVDFAFANLSVGTAVVSDLMLTPLMPVAAGLLVYSNLGAFKGAADQLRRGQIGLPALYSSIVGVTLASGQFLSAALMLWFYRYWERRYRRDLTAAQRALLDEHLSLPEEVRIVTADGLERTVPADEIAAGQRFRVVAGETVAVDAIVQSGAALVAELERGTAISPRRKTVGDTVAAGGRLVGGALDLCACRTNGQSRAARIARILSEATLPAPGVWSLNREAESFAHRAVTPTLVTAGAGLAIADLATAGAVLRPDYATGIGLASPLVGLRNIRSALCNGAVVRTANAFDRLAEIRCVVLDDNSTLREADAQLAEFRTSRLDEARLLPAAAAAGVWLGDPRGAALVRACRERGLVVRRTDLHKVDGDGIAVRFGPHIVRLSGSPVVAGVAAPPLFVEVDGVEVAAMRFSRSGRPEAATTVSQLRRRGLRVVLISEHSATGLAHALGVDRYAGNLDATDKLRLLHSLQRPGHPVAYVGEGWVGTPLTRAAHVSIGLTPAAAVAAEEGPDAAEIALLDRSIAPLPVLCALACDYRRHQQHMRYAVMAPNLLCVAGAFAFGFTPIVTVFVSNFGTSLAYNGARRARDASPPFVPVADDEPGSRQPDPEPIEIRTTA